MVALRRFDVDPVPRDQPRRFRLRPSPHDADWRLGYIVFAMSASVVALAVSMSCALWLAARPTLTPATPPPHSERTP